MRRDLRTVVMHELAHALVAARFGARGFLQVWRNPSGGPEQAHFSGSFTMTRQPARGGKRVKVLIGLAGFLAQFQDAAPDEQKSDIALAVETFKLAVEAGAVSKSDLRMSAGATASDIRRCLKLLTRLRPRLDFEVATNLRDGIDSARWDEAKPKRRRKSRIVGGKSTNYQSPPSSYCPSHSVQIRK
jgi:hypothetical protein